MSFAWHFRNQLFVKANTDFNYVLVQRSEKAVIETSTIADAVFVIVKGNCRRNNEIQKIWGNFLVIVRRGLRNVISAWLQIGKAADFYRQYPVCLFIDDREVGMFACFNDSFN
ncbi:hypothetical protein SDC9_127489 [bioreactor metagenome]|uniref:Uncharacterized protein n=1 Tax=bioreactor metagenome TaxID=1076179 RepID=A0A645CUQ8_9ZZZZ